LAARTRAENIQDINSEMPHQAAPYRDS